MNILFLHTENAGTAYIRMIQYADYMRKLPGIEVAYSKFDKDKQTVASWQEKVTDPVVLRDFAMLMDNADIAVCQMVVTGGAIALLCSLREVYKKPILMECDDNIFGIPSYNPGFYELGPGKECAKWAKQQMGISDGMIVATDWLKKEFSQYNSNITVIPNGIDFAQWENLKEPKPHKGIRIGWCGGGSHNEDLLSIEPVIYRILDKYKNVRFVITGGDVPKMKEHKRLKVFPSWSDITQYPQFLKNHGFDIGIAPLLDNGFNRAKSALRWMEYSALKIPTVASKIEPFEKTIINGENGIMAHTDEEWFAGLSFLIEHSQDREIMGTSAYWDVKQNYNVEDISVQYLDVLKGWVK